jgi:hypothetical protein
VSRRRQKVGQGIQVHSIVIPGFSPAYCYGAYAQIDRDDVNYQLKIKAASSRAQRKVHITLPTTPFDWRSDPATSTPHAPPAPVDVRPPSLSPHTAATAATLSTIGDEL